MEDHKLATEMQEPIILIGEQLISVGRMIFGRGINKTSYIVDRLMCNCGHLRFNCVSSVSLTSAGNNLHFDKRFAFIVLFTTCFDD